MKPPPKSSESDADRTHEDLRRRSGVEPVAPYGDRAPGDLCKWPTLETAFAPVDVGALAGEAKERNRVNGQLITERLQNNQQALSVLLAKIGLLTETRADGGRYIATFFIGMPYLVAVLWAFGVALARGGFVPAWRAARTRWTRA